jgi:tungsten cofactor oxidoreducase radical SAM maturase
MAEDTFQRLLESIAGLEELSEIVLGGIGEPTVSSLFSKAVEAFGNYSLTITTNGVINEKEKIEIMAKSASKLVFSIDGLEDRFYKIREARLEQVCNTIRCIQEIKKQRKSTTPEIYIQFVLSSDNQEDLQGVLGLAAELQAKALIVSNLIPMTQEDNKKILYSRYQNDEIREYFNKICRESLKKGVPVILPYCELKTDRRCSFVETNSAFVCASGEVSPCHRLSHQYDEYVFSRGKKVQPYSFGNVKDQSLKDIWDSPVYKSFRDMLLCNRYPSCIDCDLSDGCDFVRSSDMDCNGNTPACGDCLWSRGIAICI